jgi:farnesyl diphosphate synthase
MAGGQMLDLAAEGRFEKARRRQNESEVKTLQAMKTGALIHFACRGGAILGGAGSDEMSAVDRYGRAVGQAFQIADDILDVTGDAKTLGKQAGKDAAAGKATLVDILGADGAAQRLTELVQEAHAALSPFGAHASILLAAARFIAERQA